MNNERTEEERLIDAKELARMLGVGVTTIERMRDAGKLPRAVYPSRRTRRWRLSEIKAFIESL